MKRAEKDAPNDGDRAEQKVMAIPLISGTEVSVTTASFTSSLKLKIWFRPASQFQATIQ